MGCLNSTDVASNGCSIQKCLDFDLREQDLKPRTFVLPEILFAKLTFTVSYIIIYYSETASHDFD